MSARTLSARARASRAFTLVEVLVVAATVALLMGLLLPGLSGARRAGQGVACLSNLRQLQTANEVYANEHRGHYAPGAPDFAANRTRWFGARAGASGAFSPSGGPLSGYLGPTADGPGARASGAGVRACPTASPLLDASGAGAFAAFERASGAYGYNNAFVGTLRRPLGDAWVLVNDRSGAPQHAFAQPGTTLAFGDSAMATPHLIEYSFLEPPTRPDDPALALDASMHFRHGGARLAQAQAAFLDGHARALELGVRDERSIYGAVPARTVLGWPVLGRDIRFAPR